MQVGIVKHGAKRTFLKCDQSHRRDVKILRDFKREQFSNMLRFISRPPTKYLCGQHWMITKKYYLSYIERYQNQYRELHSVQTLHHEH